MKKKILRVTTVSLSLHTLLKGQLSFLNNYYEVVGVASGKDLLKEVSIREGIRTVHIKMFRKINILLDLYSLLSLAFLLIKEKPYIVHANTPKASLLSMLAAWVIRIPHRIYTVTGLRFETTTGNFRKLLITMEKITCWCATEVIPEGEGVKRTLLREKITKKPLNVILNGNINGVDTEYFNHKDVIIQQAFNIPKKEKYTFCFVGRLVKDKGIHELVNAFIRLNSVYSDTHLLLVGPLEKKSDPLSPVIERLISEHKSVSFVGFQKDIRPFLADSDVLVFPSYREGFPNVVLQAGAMGLPSIVTDINGCNEIICDGVNGKIIPPQNEEALYSAMKYFYLNRDGEVLYMAQNARPMIVERFEQRKVWDALLKEYQSLE